MEKKVRKRSDDFPQRESILDDFGDSEFFDFCGDLFDLCTPAIVRHTDSRSKKMQ